MEGESTEHRRGKAEEARGWEHSDKAQKKMIRWRWYEMESDMNLTHVNAKCNLLEIESLMRWGEVVNPNEEMMSLSAWSESDAHAELELDPLKVWYPNKNI